MSKKGKFGTLEVVILVFVTVTLSLIFGFYIGLKRVNSSNENIKYIDKFKENYDYIVENYYGEIDKDALIDNAIAGMVASLDDDYSLFTYDKETDISEMKLKGEYEGIGITITQDDKGEIYVIGVEKNSSAEENKVEIGSKIKEINETDISKMSINEVTKLIKNSENKKVKLKLEKDSEEKEVVLERKKIIFDSVSTKVYKEENKNIGYVKIDIFALNTAEQFKEEMKELEKNNIDSLIIDVRDNGGGHLSTTKEIASYFLNSKNIIYQIESKGEKTKYYSTGKNNKNYPIAILTNNISASGSELLTASLKENLGAVSIGEKTYGKGTVQEMKDVGDNSKYKITTEKWLTPTGKCVDGEGVAPSIEVKQSEEYQKNPTEESDAQLQKALEFLKNK